MERESVNELNNFETYTLPDNNNSSKVLKSYANYLYSTTHEKEKSFEREDSDDDSDSTINVNVQSQEDLSTVGLLHLSFNNFKLSYNCSRPNFNTFNNPTLSYNSPHSTINNVNYHQSINFNYLLPDSQPIECNRFTNNVFASPYISVNEFRPPSCVCNMNFLPRKFAVGAFRKRKCSCDLQEGRKEKCGSRSEALRDAMLIGNGTLPEANKKEISESKECSTYENEQSNEIQKECDVQLDTSGFIKFNKCVENADRNQSFLTDEHFQQEHCEPSTSSLNFVENVGWSKGFLNDEHFLQPCESFASGTSTQNITGAKDFFIENRFQQSYDPSSFNPCDLNSSFNEGFNEKNFQNILLKQNESPVIGEIVGHPELSSVSETFEKLYESPQQKSNFSGRNEENLKYLYEREFKVGFIDTHCHIDFLFKKQNFTFSFKKFVELSAKRDPFPKSFEGCVAVFCDPQTFYKLSWWEEIISNDMVWGAFGCHPHFSDNFGSDEEKVLRFALNHEKVKATGEIGLDYSGRNDKDHDLQKAVFEKQLTIALDIRKPIVIHCREAFSDAFEIMKRMLPKNYLIHLHCFTGTLYEAYQWMESFPNLYFGFTCIVAQTSKRAMNVRRVVQSIPLNRILLETDAPYFRPACLKDGYNSHPGMAIHVAATISELHQIPIEKVLETTRINTHDVYNI